MSVKEEKRSAIKASHLFFFFFFLKKKNNNNNNFSSHLCRQIPQSISSGVAEEKKQFWIHFAWINYKRIHSPEGLHVRWQLPTPTQTPKQEAISSISTPL